MGDNLKNKLREEVTAKLRTLVPEERAKAEQRIRASIFESAVWNSAKSILFYAPFRDEVDIWPLVSEAIDEGKRVALPAFDVEHKAYVARVISCVGDCLAGKYGIREPGAGAPLMELNQLDLILVPGVAFDLKGSRLGRGKGFYDRLLAGAPGTKCGVAFDQQVVELVPTESHDVQMNCLFTPSRGFVPVPRSAV